MPTDPCRHQLGVSFSEDGMPVQAETTTDFLMVPPGWIRIVAVLHPFHLLTFMGPLSSLVRRSWGLEIFHARHCLTSNAGRPLMSDNDHHLLQPKEYVDNEGDKDKRLYQLSKLF
jgi:hypothetical protein